MAAQPNDGLSPREIDVMQLVAAGKANKEIARELGIAVTTVKHHIEAIFRKYGVCTRTAAVVEWLRRRGGAE
ncbi:MAG TPA: LuxR C-terminal-related transcriptional regulator [Tepidiformaceae bacterium]|nr:LuxR C-terminal-related transcriptional regulator [Tepidiformaceae bacterium]HSE43730.1 LuxR C-terminal-related transcriptional regulator [Gemmatimonadales bacterium]